MANVVFRSLLASCCLFALPAMAAPKGNAGNNLDIAAIVGGEAISSYDVENRIKFIVATAQMSDTPDVIQRIRPSVVRSLIDEKLQVQEAAKNDVTVTDKDVDQAIAGIEAQRGMPPGTIEHITQASGVPKNTFTQQIRAQLLWSKLLSKKIRPNVHISDEEVRMAGQKFAELPVQKAVVPQELKISVINLPVDKPSREPEMRKLAEKLVSQVRGGASFEEVSRQFSSATANAGGKVEAFWVRPGQLDPMVAHILETAKAGDITTPLRNSNGFTIIKVYDTRPIPGAKAPKPAEAPQPAKDSEIYLKEILLKMKPDAGSKEIDVMLQVGADVAKNPGTCAEKNIASIGSTEGLDIDVSFRRSVYSELTPALKTIVSKLKVGDISTPFASYEGIRLYMLCEKKEIDAKPLDRERVFGMLMQEKMDLEAQKYLRNLRRETFIEVR
jgi:peptidyl-prolyl cis-trans isomerase SurA